MTTTGQRVRRKGGYFAPVLILLGALVAANYVIPYREILAQNRQVESARVELETLQAGNERLVRQTEALRSPTEIERLAREDYGYVRPGDSSYVIVEPVGRPVVQEPEPDVEIESGGVLKAIWDYLTGRDLTDDG